MPYRGSGRLAQALVAFMKRPLAFLCCLILIGCSHFDPFEFLFGIKRNTAVLSEAALDVSATPQKLVPTSSAEVVGKRASVCIGLEDGYVNPHRAGDALDTFAKTEFLAVVHASDGQSYDFKCPSIMFEKDAHSACVSPSCRKSIPVGTKVESVYVSASAPVHGTRAFWVSINTGEDGN